MRFKLTLFECGWILLQIKTFLGLLMNIDIPEMIDKLFVIFIVFLFALSLMKKRIDKKCLFIYVVIMMCAIYSGFASGYMILTTSVVSIIALHDEDLMRVAKKTYKIQSLLLCMSIIYSLVSFAVNKNFLWFYRNYGTRLCFNMGFKTAAMFSYIIMNLSILWIFINYEKYSFKNMFILICVAVINYLLTDSGVTVAVSMLLIIGLYIVKHTNIFTKLLRVIAVSIVPFLTGIMLISIKLFEMGFDIGYKIDNLLNSRVKLCGYNLERYGTTFLGQYCKNGAGPFILKWRCTGSAYDDVYMWLLINIGAIWLLIIEIAIIYNIRKRTKEVFCYIIAWALCALVDTAFLNSSLCFFMLFLGGYKNHYYKNNLDNI